MASGVMAEAGAMVLTSDSDLTDRSKVSVLQLLRMSLHARLCTTTLLAPSRARTHGACLGSSIAGMLHSTGSRVGAGITLRDRRRAARRQESADKSKTSFQTFCPQLWPSTVRVVSQVGDLHLVASAIRTHHSVGCIQKGIVLSTK